MRQIELTQGKVGLVDDNDYAGLNQVRWCAHKNQGSWYAVRSSPRGSIAGKHTILMHRVILDAKPSQDIDHIDGNGLNNQRGNLRFCTDSENQCNSKKRRGCSSQYKGVAWNRGNGKWMAYIRVLGKRIHLGYFEEEEDAAKVYDAAAVEHFRQFARPNMTGKGAG